MNARKIATVSAAAVAAVALSVPAVHAQSEAGAGSAEGATSSLQGGEAGSTAGTDTGSVSSDSLGAEGGSIEGLVPAEDDAAECVLPGLGGSVGKIYPLLGITGVPSIVVTLATSALDSFPNALDLIGGEDGGAALLGQTGSLEGPICKTLLGGRMTTTTAPTTPPQVTVIVDQDGNPISTVTGAPATSTATSTSTPASSAATSTSPTSVPTGSGSASGSLDSGSLGGS